MHLSTKTTGDLPPDEEITLVDGVPFTASMLQVFREHEPHRQATVSTVDDLLAIASRANVK